MYKVAIFINGCYEETFKFDTKEERQGFVDGSSYGAGQFGGGDFITIELPLSKEFLFDYGDYEVFEDWYESLPSEDKGQ